MRIRYGRWSGTQDPFGPQISADDVLDEIGDELMAGTSPDDAIAALLRSGMSGRAGMSGRLPGLSQLRAQVEQARRRELNRMGLEGPLQQVEQELSRIIGQERAALELQGVGDSSSSGGDALTSASPQHLDSMGNQERQDFLDGLPSDVAGKVAALSDYDFFDQRAGEEFAALLRRLRQEIADATFGRLASTLGQASGEDLARTRDLLADINALVAARERGEDIEQRWEQFRDTYAAEMASLGNPESLDALLEEMARRMAAMSSLMAGLSPDQRNQLAQLAQEVLGDMDMAFEADQLQRTLRREFPGMGWDEAPEGSTPSGEESGSLSQTLDWVERLKEMEDLGTAMGQQYPGARLEDVDADAVRGVLGEEAAQNLEALRAIEKVLEEAGAVTRRQGKLELTPRGIKRLGERSLARIYDRAMSGNVGGHQALSVGGGGELTGATRPLRFGDPFRLDVPRTITNAVRRSAIGGQRVTLSTEDFELAEAERRVRAATVLLLDMSFSMPLRGNWGPAKKVALALQALISGKFPEDSFYIVGFSDYARRLRPQDLLVSGWERVYGTNMQHAFMIARRLLNAHPGAERQIIMVTDGEPTAHLEGERATFCWPPEPRTLYLTMKEADRIARSQTTLNVFLLDHDPGAAVFIERMVSRCGGRIFYPDLDNLGQVVVRDYLHRRAG